MQDSILTDGGTECNGLSAAQPVRQVGRKWIGDQTANVLNGIEKAELQVLSKLGKNVTWEILSSDLPFLPEGGRNIYRIRPETINRLDSNIQESTEGNLRGRRRRILTHHTPIITVRVRRDEARPK
ncbi:MAG TPA: hypothetical protein VGO47_04705 [Chlamydiales bacterium]|nr:hypothetical protein [Chlamydiales bacterium]